jgi:hypothetical protein
LKKYKNPRFQFKLEDDYYYSDHDYSDHSHYYSDNYSDNYSDHYSPVNYSDDVIEFISHITPDFNLNDSDLNI